MTNDSAIAERVRLLRGGQAERNYHVELGVNSRLYELQAAILRVRLAALDPDVVSLPPRDPGHVYHLFAVRSTQGDALRAHLWHSVSGRSYTTRCQCEATGVLRFSFIRLSERRALLP